jgi:hypothetical protein
LTEAGARRARQPIEQVIAVALAQARVRRIRDSREISAGFDLLPICRASRNRLQLRSR